MTCRSGEIFKVQIDAFTAFLRVSISPNLKICYLRTKSTTMKILKYILFVLLAIVALFFIIGLMNPSISYGHTITVEKPVEEAWAVAQDESKYAQWLDGFKSIELIEGEDKQPGSKYRVVVNPGEGQPDFEMIETLKEVRENEYVDMHFESDFMDFDQIMTFTENDGVTTIKTDSKVWPKGIVMRSMFAIMEMVGGSFTKQEARNMEALKVLINDQ